MQILATSQIGDTFVPNSILKKYNELIHASEKSIKWKDLKEEKLWQELCFCILSANVSSELVESVIQKLTDHDMLNYRWMLEDNNSKTVLFSFLNTPNFEPIKKNGELRKYRYPKMKSSQIIDAAIRLYSDNSIKETLEKFDSDIAARNFFYTEIAGLGIKEASHFLRNIGFASSLAIIDVHVLNFLRQFSLVQFNPGSSLTLSRYLLLEKILKNLAEYHGLELSIFDLAIWQSMKNDDI